MHNGVLVVAASTADEAKSLSERRFESFKISKSLGGVPYSC
jgi:hypothetical protein